MKTSTNYVAYLRVSTIKQTLAKKTTQSEGLSFDSQLNIITSYINTNGGTLTHSFNEAKSGKKIDRVTLYEAIAYCKQHKCKLIVSHMDRLTRDAGLWYSLQSNGIDIVCCDVPPNQPLVAGMMAIIADHQGKSISEKVKSGLARLKDKGVKLGNPNVASYAHKAGKRSGEINSAKALLNNKDLITRICEYRNKFNSTFEDIAISLNNSNTPTPTGKQWSKSSVYIMYNRYCKA